MFRSLHVAATGMAAQETQLDAISNNIANANTHGYKKQRVDFQDLLYQTVREAGMPTSATTQNPSALQLGSGVRVVGTPRIHSQGSTVVTNNPLDVTIEGDGLFVVRRNDGNQYYTRNGAFQKDSTGQIVTSDGWPIEPPISVPEETISVSIGADGTVSAQVPGQSAPVRVGQIETAMFVNPTGLKSIGHNLFQETEASGRPMFGEPSTDGRGALMQGALETSNVEVVEEMIGMISAQRNYEMNSKVITAADEMLRAATQLK